MKIKNKSSLGYALFLAVYVVLVLLVALFLLSKLWSFAKEYEISRPQNTMDAYVADLNANLWNDGVAATIRAMPHEFQTDDECVDSVKELLSGGITYARTADNGADDVLYYSIRCATGVIGQVKLVPDTSKKSEMHFDMLPWVVAEESFDFNGLYSSIRVTVPKSYTVTLNGKALDESYIIEDNIKYSILEEYYDAYPDLPTKVTYFCNQIIGTMEPVIYDENGEIKEVDPSAGDDQFLANCSEQDVARLTDFVERFALRYARYTSGLGDDAATAYHNWLSGYLVQDSDLARRMIAAQDGLYWVRAYSVSITSLEINSIISFGSGVYLCDYSEELEVVRATTDVTQSNVKIIVIDNKGDLRVAEYNKY